MSEHSVSQAALMEPDSLVDLFVTNVLLPTTQRPTIRASEVHKWFETFCEHVGAATPTVQFTTRRLKKRFQHRRVNGYLEFYCELNPNLRAD